MVELKKELSLYGLTMVAIGSCIGSGIFLTPSQIAGHLPAPLLILLVWGLGGVITLTGALTFAELGAMFPQAGGVYVYLKEAYGD
nr:amino acid permease [Candidatus Aenigmarchaeota archaeon]